MKKIELVFKDRQEFWANYLRDALYGGLIVPPSEGLKAGDAVVVEVKLEVEEIREVLFGVVLWRRQPDPSDGPEAIKNVKVGIGFFSSEVEPRDRLLKGGFHQENCVPVTTLS